MGGTELQPHEIYEKLKVNVPGNTPLFNAQVAASKLEQLHTGLVDRINSLSSRMDAAWQGNAAQAAVSGAHPLKTSLDQSATDLLMAKSYMTHQSTAYATAASKVQPVPTGDAVPHNNFGNEITPWHTDLDTKIANYNSLVDGNKAAYTAYNTSSDTNGKAIPQQYGTLNTSAASIQMEPTRNTPSGSYGGYSGSTGGGGYSGGPGSYTGPRYQPPQPIQGGPTGPGTGPQPQPIPGGPGQPPVNPTPIIGNDPVGAGPGLPGPGGGGSTPPGFNPGGGSGPGGNGPGGGGTFGGGFGPGGGFGGAGGGDSAGGSGGRGGRGVGFGGVDGEGGSGQRGGSRGPGGGFGPGSEEGAMGRGGRGGAPGRPGAPGAGGMGAGRGAGAKGEEDGEHRSASYLESDYSDEIIGDLGMTAPPVIGE